MISSSNPLTLLTLCTLFVLLIGMVSFIWGKHLPGKGLWLSWLAMVIFVAGLGIDCGLFFNEPFEAKSWSVGWIGSRQDLGAITIGVFQDALAIAMSFLAALVAITLIVDRADLPSQWDRNKSYGPLIVSMAGVALSWNSMTPWMALGGLMFVILGGFLLGGVAGDSNQEAKSASRFLMERVFGFLLSFLGSCVLAVSRPALTLDQPLSWLSSGGNPASTWVGSFLLVFGLFLQAQPFPFLGWVVLSSELSPPFRILLNQIFPAWSAFALLVRLEPFLTGLGLFPHLGWFALASSILTVFVGLFQNQWRQGLGLWLSSGFSLSFALLAFSGPLAAMSLLLGVSLGALILSKAAVGLSEENSKNPLQKNQGFWTRFVIILGASAGSGMMGFVSAVGGVRGLADALNFPGLITLFVVAIFLFGLLCWKVAWTLTRLKRVSDASWLSIFLPFFWAVLAMGWVWTGLISGDLLLGGADRLIPSLFSYFFNSQELEVIPSPELISASGIYWGALGFSMATAFWTAGRKEDRWLNLARVMPKTTRFIASGYGVDQLVHRMLCVIISLGQFSERMIDQRVWSLWIPRGLSGGVLKVSRWADRLDLAISFYLGRLLRLSVELPAKALQRVHTGDLRWYLFFALTSGLVLLSYFLKN
ncbi:MAG: hypothetical protein ACO3A2_03725 [Bdellovibrionia bacterium]